MMFIFHFYIHASNDAGVKDPHALLERQNKVMDELTLELRRSTQERIDLQERVRTLETALAQKEAEKAQKALENEKQQKKLSKLQAKVRDLETQFAQKEEEEKRRQQEILDRYDDVCKMLEREMDILMGILLRNIKNLDEADEEKINSVVKRLKRIS